MATKTLFVFILSLLLRASLSLPVSLDIKTVQSTDSVPESGLTERTLVLSSETILRIEKDNKLVQSLSTETLLNALESFEAYNGKRIKRYITKTKVLCPKDRIEYSGHCVTKERYEEYKDGAEDSGSDDYNAER